MQQPTNHQRFRLPSAQSFHFDIDDYLNRYVPPPPLKRLPEPVSRFLGYRRTGQQDVGNLLVAFWAFVGTFCGLCLVAGVFMNSPVFKDWHTPGLIASFGATAILEYNIISSPLASPRNSLIGHGLAAIVGVAITKLFRLNSDFETIRWIAAAVSCGIASVVMTLTNTVHPPGGATALLAAIEPQITDMGWRFVPVVLIGSGLMLVVALITNNIQRKFPSFWWTPRDVWTAVKKGRSDVEEARPRCSKSDGKTAPSFRENIEKSCLDDRWTIIVSPGHIQIPEDFSLGPEEAGVIEVLRDRLRQKRRELINEAEDRQNDGVENGDDQYSGATSDAGTLTVASYDGVLTKEDDGIIR